MALFRGKAHQGSGANSGEAGLQNDELGRPTSRDPEAVAKALFDDVLSRIGPADSKAVEEQFLGWQHSRTVYRGRRAEVEPLVVMDLRHMASEPGFKNFTIQTVQPQNAAEVLCFMGEESRAGYVVAVPVRVWCTGDRYVVSGIDESWKKPTTAGSAAIDDSQLEGALSDIYLVTVDYDLSLSETIAAGSYDEIPDGYIGQVWSDWQAPDGSALRAPTSGSAERELLLFHLGAAFGEGPYPDTRKVLAALTTAGLTAEGIHELLALGRAYPDLQREFPVYELGAVWARPSRDSLVAGLIAQYRLRCLGLSSHNNLWPPQMRILVSRS